MVAHLHFLTFQNKSPSASAVFGECCHAGFLWHSRNILWPTNLHLCFRQCDGELIMTEFHFFRCNFSLKSICERDWFFLLLLLFYSFKGDICKKSWFLSLSPSSAKNCCTGIVEWVGLHPEASLFLQRALFKSLESLESFWIKAAGLFWIIQIFSCDFLKRPACVFCFSPPQTQVAPCSSPAC